MRATSARIRCVALGAACAAAVSVPLPDEAAVDLLPNGRSMQRIVPPTPGWMPGQWPSGAVLPRAATRCCYHGDVGAEVGGPAHVGPLLGFHGTGSRSLLGGVDGAGAEKEAQRWLVEAGDVDDDPGRAGGVARP